MFNSIKIFRRGTSLHDEHASGYFARGLKAYLVSFVMIGLSPLSFADVHIAQTSQGVGDGSSCASARSVSWFNSSTSWGPNSTQINPANAVQLCGTITSDLKFQADGVAGSPIIVDGTDATMNASFVAGPRVSYGKIQNAKWVDNFGRTLFQCLSCDNFIFTNNKADNWHGGSAVYLVEDGVTQLPHDLLISNNYIRTSTADFGDTQIDIIVCAGCTNTVVEGNHLEMRILGSAPHYQSHDDVIQSFRKGGSSMGYPSNLTMRYNKIVMNTADRTGHRSWCMLEMLGGVNHIYGNLFLGLSGADGSNGCNINSSQSSAVFNFFNNTMVSKGSASNNQLNLQNGGTINLRNNIFYAGGNQGWALTMANITRANNLWYGSRAPACNGAGEICTRDPMFADYINNDFSLQAAAPGVGAGLVLGSMYDKSLAAGAVWPSPRLTQRIGNWSIGAFDTMGAPGVLLAPTNLIVR